MSTYPGLTAFQSDRSHATFRNVERIWQETFLDEAVSNLPQPCKLITLASDDHYTVALGARIDNESGAILDYCTWHVGIQSYGHGDVRMITEPAVFLMSGHYRIPTLTEAVADLSARVNHTV